MVNEDDDETRKSRNNKLLIEAVMAKMTKMMDEKFDLLRQESSTRERPRIHTSNHSDREPINSYYSSSHSDQRRQRREQELNPKPPDHTSRETWRNPHKPSCTSLSSSHFDSHRQHSNEIQLYAFSGKRNYLEWERNMEDWFHYKCISEDKRMPCAIGQLQGDAYNWWCQEVDYRWYYKEPLITSWRKLKEVLRKKYAPKEALNPQQKKVLKHVPKEEMENERLKLLNSYSKSIKAKAKCSLSSKSVEAKSSLSFEYVEETCERSYDKSDCMLEIDQACEQLTLCEPVQPSILECVSQVSEEESQEEEHPSIVFEQKISLVPIHESAPVDNPQKHCKDYDLVET